MLLQLPIGQVASGSPGNGIDSCPTGSYGTDSCAICKYSECTIAPYRVSFYNTEKKFPQHYSHFSKVCILYLLRSFTVARELLFRIVRWGLESNLRPTKTTVLTWVMVGHAAPGLQGVDVVVQGVGCFTSRLPLPTLQARQNTKMYLKNFSTQLGIKFFYL